MSFLLVHGGSDAGHPWDRVADILQRQGHTVSCPILPDASGCGLADHVQAVVSALDELHASTPEPVILAGHSYGGVVVSEAAQQRVELISRLVYLDAAIPQPGRSLFDLIRAGGVDPIEAGIENYRPFNDPSQVNWRLLSNLIKLYILCLESSFRPVTQRMYDRAESANPDEHWHTATLDASHFAQEEEPWAVAELLVKGWTAL